jgi:hypothetical protein
MVEIDILGLDTKIKLNFKEEYDKVEDYIASLDELKKSLDSGQMTPKLKTTITNSISKLDQTIGGIKNNTKLNFYIVETAELLEEYKNILKTPIKVSFVGKSKKNNTLKISIISKYIQIALKYIDIDVEVSDKQKQITCVNCDNKDFSIIDENIYVCTECFAQQVVSKHTSSYNDIDRVNISSKYTYDRKVHFRDCINQYQGKQNSTIQPEVYTNLKNQFEKHHLLIGDSSTPDNIRYSNITKEHVLMFLRELDYNKHYENVHLIHYNITGIKPDDITYLEDKLLDDFDNLTAVYDKLFKHINRKNFINTQYVLFQLLRRHKHPCKEEDFSILKTIDRKYFHDIVFDLLSSTLGFNFFPYF